MARVLLIIPPLLERSYPGKFMGLDYLAGALFQKGHEVQILDLDVFYSRKYNILRILEATITKFDPHLIGITNLSIQNDVANYFAWLIRNKIYPKAKIVKGGFHEIVGWKNTLELHHEYVDAVVVGEGETAIVELADAASGRRWDSKLTEIPGVAYWDGEKAVYNSKPVEIDPNLYLPRRLNYYPEYAFNVFNFRKTTQMMTIRGCPYQCAFCSEAFFPHRVKFRDLKHIKKELDLLEKEGYEAVYFDDPSFTLKKDRAIAIAKIVKKREKRKMIWGCNTRIDLLDEKIINKLAKHDCVYLFCGVESLVPEILLAMNKTSTPKDYIEKAPYIYKWLRKNNISPNVFLIFGNARIEKDGKFTSERWEDVEKVLTKAIKLDTDYLSMNILRLLPEVPYSHLLQYSCIRPTGKEPVHGGHYDLKWYILNQKEDLRSNHPIFRAFEGARSVHPNFVTPSYAYEILKFAVELVNKHNEKSHRQIRIIYDYKAENFLKEIRRGRIFYELEKFENIPQKLEYEFLIEDWRNILQY